MKLTIAKNDLVAAQRAVGSCRSSTGSDLSTHYLFKVIPADPNTGAEQRVEVATYSGQTFASAPIRGASVEGDDADAFTIEGWRLEKWLSAVPEDGKPITFSFTPADSKIVEAKVTKGSQQFDSLDPKGFPSWEAVLAKSSVTATIGANLLHSILSYARNFISKDETKHAEQTILECRSGVLYAMNGTQMVMIKSPALENCTMRIHRKDLPSILDFLNTLKGLEVDLLEDQPEEGSEETEPTTLILRRHSTDPKTPVAILGENRFTTAFPELGTPESTDHHLWVFPKEDVLDAFPWLESGAANGEDRLRISVKDTTIKLAMQNPRGSWVTLDIESDTPEVQANAPAIPTEGFRVDKDSFKVALLAMPGERPKLGLNKLARGGYLRFVREEDPNGVSIENGQVNGVEIDSEKRTTYTTVVAWVKPKA